MRTESFRWYKRHAYTRHTFFSLVENPIGQRLKIKIWFEDRKQVLFERQVPVGFSNPPRTLSPMALRLAIISFGRDSIFGGLIRLGS